MKKTFTLLFTICTVGAFAQTPNLDMAPVVGNTPAASNNRALFDIQLDVSPLPIAAGLAGACWTGTEFWVSRWANDSLFTADGTGAKTASFVIAGISGTRSITTDGTNLYLGNATNTISIVNPTTKTLVGTITSASADPARYLTYDATLNGGAGGFWHGNFTTDWTAISMTGSVLSTISAATHGLTGVYGLAVDNYSSGGPYLWAFDQAFGAGADVVQLSITGVQTGVTHDATLDLAGGNTGIAGGISVCNNFMTGTISLVGLNQGVSLFSYELGNLSSVNETSSLVSKMDVYPNPTNNLANVSFTLATASDVTIEIYNTIGVLATTLNTKSYGVGAYNVAVNTNTLESGSYLVKLTTSNGENFVKRLVVQK
jgi:hypothetical protein